MTVHDHVESAFTIAEMRIGQLDDIEWRARRHHPVIVANAGVGSIQCRDFTNTVWDWWPQPLSIQL